MTSEQQQYEIEGKWAFLAELSFAYQSSDWNGYVEENGYPQAQEEYLQNSEYYQQYASAYPGYETQYNAYYGDTYEEPPTGENEAYAAVDTSADGYAGYYYDPESGAYYNYDGGYESPTAEAYTGEDDLALENASYYQHDQGDWNGQDGYAVDPSVNLFKDEAYGEQEAGLPSYQLDAASNTSEHLSSLNDSETNEANPTLSTEPNGVLDVQIATSPAPISTAIPTQKTKTKKERIQKRQEQLEKEEEERRNAENNSTGGAIVPSLTAARLGKSEAAQLPRQGRNLTFLEREKAKMRLRMRKAKAISRKRMPVQIRVLTEAHKHLSPMDKYFDSVSIECVFSDIFWAAIKGDVRRIRQLVEIECVSVTDSKFDPWNLQQTPLHWGAKGGSVEVIEYLLQAGANVRSLDENGSMPLHLACWAGHVDATLVLLRASDPKDLYVQDYDAALAPLDWANVRGHTSLLRAIGKFEDSLWLPKFVDDLIRGIVRYKIKIFKEPPKTGKVSAKRSAASANDTPTTAEAPIPETAAALSTSSTKEASASV